MGIFDKDSIVGMDVNGDGRIDVFDDVYMQNLAATGDGYLSEEDARMMEDDDELDPMLMDEDEIREAIENGELDEDDIDFDLLDSKLDVDEDDDEDEDDIDNDDVDTDDADW